jgi:thiamine monophosphate synthase
LVSPRSNRPAIYLHHDRKLARSVADWSRWRAALAVAPPDTVALQLREKDLEARTGRVGAKLRAGICDRHHAWPLVNDRLDVVIVSQPTGSHTTNSFDVAD